GDVVDVEYRGLPHLPQPAIAAAAGIALEDGLAQGPRDRGEAHGLPCAPRAVETSCPNWAISTSVSNCSRSTAERAPSVFRSNSSCIRSSSVADNSSMPPTAERGTVSVTD